MSDLERIVGNEKVFHTVGEYRLAVGATVVAPCVVGVVTAVCERFGATLPTDPESLTYGVCAAAAGTMGYFAARHTDFVGKSRGASATERGIAITITGVVGSAIYGGFAWIGYTCSHWWTQFCTSHF